MIYATLARHICGFFVLQCAMETCLAGHSPESINSVLVEKSLQLSTVECSLQSNMAELEKVKHECAVLQVNFRELMIYLMTIADCIQS